MGSGTVCLFLCGDVMLGRGVDQVLPNAGDPVLDEPFMRDARAYVDLAEKAHGPVPRPVGGAWPWGDALAVLDSWAPDVRIVNLETSVTRCGGFAPGKSVHYRMSPGNVDALVAGEPDVCVLANNHTMDFGHPGLIETLDTLRAAGLRSAGAGRHAGEAERPVTVETGGGRVLVSSVGTASAGVPAEWRAEADRPGVAMVDLRRRDAVELAGRIQAVRRPGDVVVVSVHWGSNWGYGVAQEQADFAHELIDAGVDVVHGHSSHHPRPIEVYRGKLILYGCGDFINDYEGIGGYEEYRDDLRLMYFAEIDAADGSVAELRMVPLRARRLRLEHAVASDRAWLAEVLDEVSAEFGVRITERDAAVGPERVHTLAAVL
ncbi:CapA family protein [Phytoactinopolyspora halotolerans]|uniref:CapA family protein n=1 Tax=Phytoactinopolyspora halotolerans TaxID=1981512 RepID=A0A6L9SFK9_9ACTN|nr:CapA family protein [Phytoactinopolyspora halotolerans]NEE02840.1 CapA family protein [Phytoactinopolyspora halotolerans]